MYVAVLPASATNETGGSINDALTQLGTDVGRRGTYVLVAGRKLRAGSTANAGLDEGVTPDAADAALKAHRRDGLSAILLDFTDRIGEARAGGGSGGGSGGGGGGGGGGRGPAVGPRVA